MKMAYHIEYEIYDVHNDIIKTGTIKVKNKDSEIQTKVELEKYLKKKYKNFNRLIINECREDFFSIFGISNPF